MIQATYPPAMTAMTVRFSWCLYLSVHLIEMYECSSALEMYQQCSSASTN